MGTTNDANHTKGQQPMTIHISHQEWLREAERRYGKSLRNLRFKCPVCGHVQSGQDFLDLGMSPEHAAARVGFSCIGRLIAGSRRAFGGSGAGPCDFTNGGLFTIGPVVVQMDGSDPLHMFDFADQPLDQSAATATSVASA